MDKYYAFRKMLDFVSDEADVVDADLNYFNNSMRIVGETETETITIEGTIEKKEVEVDA